MSANALSVKALAKAIDGEFEGDGDIIIIRPADPRFAGKDEIALAADIKYLEALKSSSARVAIIPKGTNWREYGLDAAIFVKEARRTMVELAQALEVPWSRHWASEPIHPSAIIHPSVKLGRNVLIGPYSVIGENVALGDNSVIHDHVTIAQDTHIGANALLYSGVRVGPEVAIGDEVIIMPNAVIGADGFSYLTPNAEAIRDARNAKGISELSNLQIERINSLGSVEIGDRVEIGANSAIDRGTLKNTKIGAGTKIDNLVHIAHNVEIGENCFICGQVGIAGSAIIGDRTMLGGQVGVADNTRIGSDVIAAGKSAISSKVASGQVVMGNPAIKMSSNIESYKAYRRLPALFARVKEIEEKLRQRSKKK